MESGEKIQETKQSTEQRNIEMARAYVKNDHKEIKPDHNGEITQEMLAEHYGLTASRVSQIFTEMEQEADKMGIEQ